MARLDSRQGVAPIVVGFCMLLAVCSASPCGADEATEAKEKFLLGMELVQAENYQDALEAFEASYRIVPKASVLYNIGMCQKALFRYADAMASFNQFLVEVGSLARPEMVEAVEESLRQLELLVARLTLDGAPAGAQVEIDGRKVGTTPLPEPIVLDPGDHTLRVLQERMAFESEVAIAVGEHLTVPVTMRAALPAATEPSAAEGEVPAGQAPSPDPKLITGVALGATSLVAIGVGAYFSVQYNQHQDEMDAAQTGYQNAPDEASAEPFWEEYHRIQDDELPGDRAGMIGFYVAGGVLLATGAVLVVMSLTKRNKEELPAVSVVPTLGGVTIHF